MRILWSSTVASRPAETSQNVPVYIRVMDDAADADGDALKLSIDQYPEHGTVEVNNAGTPDDTSDDFVIYRPDTNFNGADSFTDRKSTRLNSSHRL